MNQLKEAINKARLLQFVGNVKEFQKAYKEMGGIIIDELFVAEVKAVAAANHKKVDVAAIFGILFADDIQRLAYETKRYECESTAIFADRIAPLRELFELSYEQSQKEWTAQMIIHCYASLGDLENLENACKEFESLVESES